MMRLQVFLSHNGVCSRRRAFEIIKAGCVTVNGRKVLEPSWKVDPGQDRIAVSEKEVNVKFYEYILLNKPQGYVTTRQDRFAEKTIYKLLPPDFKHLVPAGRLDKDTEGLLLLTNDGDVVHRLTHPRHAIDKVYFVRIQGKLSEDVQKKIERGVWIEHKKTSPARIAAVKVLKDTTEFMITIHEGRKRQIRLMFAQTGHPVIYLKRTAQGPLSLGKLKTGEWRKLNEQEITALKSPK